MYDMYPEWGPAQNDPTHPLHGPRAAVGAASAVQASLDLRDNGGQRPDDN